MNEIEKAAERYRREAYQPGHFGEADYRNTGYLTSEQGWDDRVKLSNWAVEQLRPDDSEAIDAAWLESVGCKWNEKAQAFYLMHHRLIIAVRLSGQWWMEFDSTYGGTVGTYNKLATKGAFRKVCAALGVKLKG